MPPGIFQESISNFRVLSYFIKNQLLPVAGRRLLHYLCENTGERIPVAETAFLRYLLDTLLRMIKQLACVFNTFLSYEILGGLPGLLFK